MKTIRANSLQVFWNIVPCFWGKQGSSETKLLLLILWNWTLWWKSTVSYLWKRYYIYRITWILAKYNFGPEMSNRIFYVILRRFWVVHGGGGGKSLQSVKFEPMKMGSAGVHPDLLQRSWSLFYWLDVDTRKLHNDCLKVSEPDKTSTGKLCGQSL